MSQVSPPIRILLVCAVAFLAAWMLFLRPKADAGAPVTATPAPAATAEPAAAAGGAEAQSGAGQLAERAANGVTEAGDGTAATTDPATAVTPATGAAPAAGTEKAETVAGTLPPRVKRALAARKTIVLLFWTPKATEDQDVRAALSGIDRHKGRVLAHATHVKRIATYQQITRGARVDQSPTIVIVDRNRNVATLVGYVDRRTIDQAVTDARRKRNQ
jgi:hypothetical protein